MEKIYLFHQEDIGDTNANTITFSRNNQNITISEINIFICYDVKNSQKILSCLQFSNNNNNTNGHKMDLSNDNNDNNYIPENEYPKFKVEVKGSNEQNFFKYFPFHENDSTVLFELVVLQINDQENPTNNSYWIKLKKMGKLMAIGYNMIKIIIKDEDDSFSSIYTIDELKEGGMIELGGNPNINDIQYSDEFLTIIKDYFVDLIKKDNENDNFDYKINFNVNGIIRIRGEERNYNFNYGIKFFKPESKYKNCCDCCCTDCECCKECAIKFYEKCCYCNCCCTNFWYLFCCNQFLKNFWKFCVFLSKIWKFLLAFGDIFFTFILFGFYFITNTIMIT